VHSTTRKLAFETSAKNKHENDNLEIFVGKTRSLLHKSFRRPDHVASALQKQEELIRNED